MTRIRRAPRHQPTKGEQDRALVSLLVQLGEIVSAHDFGPMEPYGYGGVNVAVRVTLDQVRAAYPALHRLVLGRDVWDDERVTVDDTADDDADDTDDDPDPFHRGGTPR